MPDLHELDQAIEEAIGEVSASVAKETHLPHDPLSNPQVKAKQIEQELRQQIQDFRKKCVEGLKCCINALAGSEDFVVLELKAAFQKIDDLNIIGERIASGFSCKELLGIAERTMEPLYKAAKWLIDQKRYEDAQAAFTFLVLLDHAQYCYWLGLGHASTHLKQLDQAIDAYEKAQTIDQHSCWPHVAIANCLIEKNDFSGALEELEVAQKLYARENHKDRDIEQALLDRIIFVKNRGRV